jgi:16S rRNA (adenine1518-N6/adenine1519-N6)-dimethyltransferase
LLERIRQLHVVELDRDLVARLRGEYPPERVQVHEADALEFDFCALVPHRDAPMSRDDCMDAGARATPGAVAEAGSRERPAPGARLRLIGNLPYNISTPLLFHLLDQAPCIGDMLFMLQKEVVERMAAAPDTPEYGRLSVMIQWRCAVERLFDIGPGAFNPPPRVDSSIVRLTPHPTPPVAVDDPKVFADVVKAAFAHRRKTLRNNLKGLVSGEAMAVLGIAPERRAETLTLAEFARLANCAAG